MCKQPCELEFMGFMRKKLLDKKTLRQTIASILFTPYIRICLLMRNQNTHKNMNHTSNTVVI